ncbi:uncharacterized protein B0I36DRAFT_312011 [Microdochium trichocladiopsis]|uniref:Uncharacterized protein n=1 Tax=Microdochium trichocladiopsis TaxID=1682393 RepID=A0A9P8YID4_9PEZI|nr:uncharacterized protein B0I36DRAFT_312011 [Microdochium trichocladiopsis]KAH7041046.1 hypothetical protein B0I36DRAFT_312011 [Microdochium trichocladiopsis]
MMYGTILLKLPVSPYLRARIFLLLRLRRLTLFFLHLALILACRWSCQRVLRGAACTQWHTSSQWRQIGGRQLLPALF